jgi:hypothetical protein
MKRITPIEDYEVLENRIIMTDKMRTIFEALLWGGKTAYKMSLRADGVGISLSRIHDLCVEMEDRGFIRSEETQESGRNKRIFYATMAGLWSFYWSKAGMKNAGYGHFTHNIQRISRLGFFQSEMWQGILKEEPLLAFICFTRNLPKMSPSKKGGIRFDYPEGDEYLLTWLIGALEKLTPDAEQYQKSLRVINNHPQRVISYLEARLEENERLHAIFTELLESLREKVKKEG